MQRLRSMTGLSARAVSEAAGVAHPVVSYLEDGTRTDPRSSTMRALAETFGVSLDWLIRGEGPEPSPETVRAAVERARAARAEAAEPEVAA